MTVQILYKNKDNSNNLVLFAEEGFNISGLKKHISNMEYSYLNDLLKTFDLKKSLLVFEVSSKRKIILISIKKNLETSDVENLGAEFYSYINYGNKGEFNLIADTIKSNIDDFIGYFLHGLKLKSYEFNLYKSKKEKKIFLINVIKKKINI